MLPEVESEKATDAAIREMYSSNATATTLDEPHRIDVAPGAIDVPKTAGEKVAPALREFMSTLNSDTMYGEIPSPCPFGKEYGCAPLLILIVATLVWMLFLCLWADGIVPRDSVLAWMIPMWACGLILAGPTAMSLYGCVRVACDASLEQNLVAKTAQQIKDFQNLEETQTDPTAVEAVEAVHEMLHPCVLTSAALPKPFIICSWAIHTQ